MFWFLISDLTEILLFLWSIPMLRETEISAMPMQRNSLGYQQQKNTYNTFGSLKGSWVMDGETKFGTKGELGFAKFQENRFNINGNVTTKDWDINDVGFSTRTNFGNYNAWYGYRILQPTKTFNNMYLNFNLNYYHRLEPLFFRI
jgi:hypothetical protein